MRDACALELLHPVVRDWFETAFGRPSPPQTLGWPAIAAGENALILAPTGSGKTLAAFLVCLDRLYRRALAGELEDGVHLLYVSPLKALNHDIHRNLRAPLEGIAAAAAARGIAWPELRAAVRTGDTSQRERVQMARRPPHVLITTPESLYLLLTSPRAREVLRTVRHVIVDEVHALAGNKRGCHVALSLERLEALAGRALQRIGLSATQRPLREIARFLGGLDDAGAYRPVRIVDAGMRKDLDLLVVAPVEDLRAPPGDSVWSGVWPSLLELVRQHRSTLIFVNNRRLAERVASHLNELAGERLAQTHHGSMSREAREQVESLLKEGRLPALVATSSLELGIDVGAVDCVAQIESPKAVARGLQRVGRAGHLVGHASKGRIIALYRADLLEAAAIARAMRAGEVEETRVPHNPLDVLAQQVTAMAAVETWHVPALHALLRRAYPYRDLSREQLDATLEMLSGRYPAEQFGELRPRLHWDRVHDRVVALPGALRLAVGSGGTIPDRGYFHVVHAGSGVRLGELDEEFVYETRVGDVFLLGTSTWRVEAIEADRVLVSDAHGAPARMPFWKGDGLGRPYELGLLIGRLVREAEQRLDEPPEAFCAWLRRDCCLDVAAAANLRAFLADQRDATGSLPSDRRIVVEVYRDELGDWRIAVLSPFGARIHAGLALLIGARLRERLGYDPQRLHADNGIMFRLSATDAEPPADLLSGLRAADVEDVLVAELSGSPLLFASFRQAAERALLLPRRQPGKRLPLWLQRLRAADLLQVARRHARFPVVLEAYRECMTDVLDLPHLRRVVAGVERGEIAVEVRHGETPSPWVAALQFAFIAAFMYEGDVPRAERQAQLLQVNRDLLRDALGPVALRGLLDPRAVEETARDAGRAAAGRRARTADEVAELLLQLGDLSDAELADRTEGGGPAAARFISSLAAEGRAVRVPLGPAGAAAGARLPAAAAAPGPSPPSEARWMAAEDVPLYLAAYGGEPLSAAAASLPPHLAAQDWDAAAARRAILRRWARGRGPFTLGEAVARHGWPAADVLAALGELVKSGALVEGEFSHGRAEPEWCDAENLRRAHRRTLALLRREVEPRAPAEFARFLARWHGCQPAGAKPRGYGAGSGPAALRRVLSRLQGLALPAEVWERDVLPRRLPGYDPAWLDQLCASGEVLWQGSGRGRIAFYLRGDAASLRPVAPAGADAGGPSGADPAGPSGEPVRLVRDALRRRGALFLHDIAAFTGLPGEVALIALWDLVWAGEATNDTFAPVRHAGLLRHLLDLAPRAPGSGPPSRAARACGARRPPGRRAFLRGGAVLLRARLHATALAGGGRWSWLGGLGTDEPASASSDGGGGAAGPDCAARQASNAREVRAYGYARLLLERYGVVTREAVELEGAPPWGTVLVELRRMELRGEARQGYFVRGLSGPQFALPEAIEQLRQAQDQGTGDTHLLAATDPANPYGGLLPSPRLSRLPSTYGVLRGGRLVLAVEGGGKRLDPADGASEDDIVAAAHALAELLQGPRLPGAPRRLTVESWAGQPVTASPAAQALAAAGFQRGPRHMVRFPTR